MKLHPAIQVIGPVLTTIGMLFCLYAMHAQHKTIEGLRHENHVLLTRLFSQAVRSCP